MDNVQSHCELMIGVELIQFLLPLLSGPQRARHSNLNYFSFELI